MTIEGGQMTMVDSITQRGNSQSRSAGFSPVQWSTTKLILSFLGFQAVITLLATLFGIFNPQLQLNESQILYLFSTSAQVVAAVYGLTLAGYAFLHNELSREESDDDTSIESIESLKQRYFTLLLFVTVQVLFAALLSNLAIAQESSVKTGLTTLLLNAGQTAVATSLLVIAYFVFEIADPRNIKLASGRLKEQVDPSLPASTKGDLSAFLKNYNEIEALLEEAGTSFRPSRESSLSLRPNEKSRKSFSNIRLAEILYRNEQIDASLFARLKDLVTVRNAIIHGANPVVSTTLVDTSMQVLADLRAALNSAGQ